ncbi:luciferin sulfotransferase-like isoform X2 [Leguminivora glycinivorella]|nr:luciferin sulfotransferase-like isoform X2 [Leguminivora glycinivorella]XP_047988247.1 luciferin sulfotransferase-like isoform X2 [Leguminivora glycinivorella]
MGDKVKIQELDSATQELLMGLYKSRAKFARFGDVGCTMPATYKEDADNMRTMAVRPDDVWVTSFPRSGTTWTQELVWLLMNNFDYDTASNTSLWVRYCFLEMKHVSLEDYSQSLELEPKLREEVKETFRSYEEIVKEPSPRFIKTHMPFSLLPANLLDTTKVVYVARDPRDVAVSFYHHNKLLIGYTGDFKTYWNLFVSNLVLFTPFFPHLKEAWALRNHSNMLFIFYEDLIKNLPLSIKRIADFLGKDASDEQITKLCEHLDINNFRKNESVNPSFLVKINPDAEGFVRRGGAGGWRQYFDEEMAAQAQRWMRDHLAGSDLRFPDH